MTELIVNSIIHLFNKYLLSVYVSVSVLNKLLNFHRGVRGQGAWYKGG